MSTNAQISHRIKRLEQEFKDNINSLGKQAGLGNATADRWTDNQIEKPTAAVKQFLSYWGISEDWWKTGQGEVFLTSDDITIHNAEKPAAKTYEETIEGLIDELKLNNRFLQKQFEEIRETNERLRADLRAANDNTVKLATIALSDGKKQ